MLRKVELTDWSHERTGCVLKIAVLSEVSGPHHLQCSSKGTSLHLPVTQLLRGLVVGVAGMPYNWHV